MTNKFNYLVHELIHVTNTLTVQDEAVAKKLYSFLMNKHHAYCKSVIRRDKEEMRSCSMIVLPKGRCSKFSTPSNVRIYTTDSFWQNSCVLSAIEQALDFTNAQVDWFASLCFGKNSLWEEFNALGDDDIFNCSAEQDVSDKPLKVDEIQLLEGSFTVVTKHHKTKKLDPSIDLCNVCMDKVIQYVILRSIVEAYDRAIRIKILDASWYTSATYIPDESSVYHLVMEVCEHEQLRRKLVKFCSENSTEYDTNSNLRNNGFSDLSDDNTIGAYYLLLSQLGKEVVNATLC